MSIRSVIERSEDDRKHFKNKSYSNINLKVSLIKSSDLFNNNKLSDMAQRIYDREYKVDRVEEIIKLENVGKDLITINQLKSIFDDIGFNTDITFSETFKSDFSISYNIGGYIFPTWKKFVKNIYPKNSKRRRILLSKLGPGKKRLHCRIYQENDGSWYVTSHIDEANWMNILSPKQLLKSHTQSGTGNYVDGTKIMKMVFKEVDRRLYEKKTLYIDIDEIYKNLN